MGKKILRKGRLEIREKSISNFSVGTRKKGLLLSLGMSHSSVVLNNDIKKMRIS